jgi:3-oxoacyl-[acyl-carrier protein] reductase
MGDIQMDFTSFHGQSVFIAGAANGIGAAAARLIAERGGKVFIMDIAEEALSKMQKELSLPDEQVSLIDLGDQESVAVTIRTFISRSGRVDALINSAGIVGPNSTKVENIPWVDFERAVRINLFGAIWLTQAVLPIMKEQKYGRIAHVASIAGKEGNPGMAPYNVAKSGLIGFVKGVGKEVAPDGIVINALAPAVIRTELNANTSEEMLAYMISRIPMGRQGEVEEVAEMLAFMASRACSFTTGVTFDASGGRATY